MEAQAQDDGDDEFADLLDFLAKLSVVFRLAKSGGDQAKNADGRKLHEQQNHLHERHVGLLDHRDQISRLLAHRGDDAGKNDRKNDERQQVHFEGGFEQIIRHQHEKKVLDDPPNVLRTAFLLSLKHFLHFLHLQPGRIGQMAVDAVGRLSLVILANLVFRRYDRVGLFLADSSAGLHQIHHENPHQNGQNRRAKVVADGDATRFAEFADIAHPENSAHHRGHHQRHDEHFEEVEEDFAADLRFHGQFGNGQRRDNGQNERNHDPERQVAVTAFADEFVEPIGFGVRAGHLAIIRTIQPASNGKCRIAHSCRPMQK